MKKIIVASILCFVIALAFGAEVIDELTKRLKKGDYHIFSKYLASSVTFNLPNNEGVYTKAQAEQILRDFFFKNPSRDYALSHQGESKDGARYFIGNLTSSNATYRTYCHLKKQGNDFKIYELRLEKE